MKPDEKTRARLKPGCICTGIRLHRILEAIEEGALTYEDIARRTGIGHGDCGGRRCRKKVAEIFREISPGLQP